MAMVDQALRDPISVSMLAIDGKDVMQIMEEKPGPRIGWILSALLEEVLEDTEKNTNEYLSEKTLVLSRMEDGALKERGEEGRQAREKAEEKKIAEILEKHHVS